MNVTCLTWAYFLNHFLHCLGHHTLQFLLLLPASSILLLPPALNIVGAHPLPPALCHCPAQWEPLLGTADTLCLQLGRDGAWSGWRLEVAVFPGCRPNSLPLPHEGHCEPLPPDMALQDDIAIPPLMQPGPTNSTPDGHLAPLPSKAPLGCLKASSTCHT
jgi:hypothetical protein